MPSDALADFLNSGQAFVFPIQPMGKLPATANGWKEATNDPAKIAEWKRINPDFNWALACGPSGITVYDIDPAGLDYWENLRARDEAVGASVKASLQVRTPRGGYHVYYAGEGPSTASRIADGIDTRGGIRQADGSIKSGGYVLLPGSRTNDGAYSVLPGGSINPLPDFMRALIPARKKTDTLGLTKNPDKDLPRNIKTAQDLLRNYIDTGRISKQGSGGNTEAWKIAASIMDKGISPGLCFDMLWNEWNKHCEPPWDDFELEIIVKNAFEHGEDTQSGVKGHQSNADAFAKFAGMETPPEELSPGEAKRHEKNRLMWLHEYAANVDDPVWLVPGLIPAHGTGMIYGFTGSFKSFIALDLALCLAYGIPGQWEIPVEQPKKVVVYFAGEGSIGTAKKRFPAWRKAHDIEFEGDHLFLIMNRVPLFSDIEEWEQIKLDLHKLGLKPDLFIVDTLARFASGTDEGSNSDATIVTNFGENLARYYECCVMYVHHEGKDASRGARGASAWLSNMDFALSTKKVEGDKPGTYLKIVKQKDADTAGDPQFFNIVPSADSIVLRKSDDGPSDQAGKTQSRYDWASVAEVCTVITHLTSDQNDGEISNMLLMAEIARRTSVDRAMIAKQLKRNDALKFLRDGDKWRVPKDRPEYDL